MTPEIWTQQRLDKFYNYAETQLTKWHPLATSWPLYHDGFANRCRKCDQNIWFSHDMYGEEYRYTPDEIVALITAHIRQAHEQEADAREEMQVQDMPESRNE